MSFKDGMGCVFAIGMLTAALPPIAVNQAEFWWVKKVTASVTGDLPQPMFLPNGDIVVVAPEADRYLITYYSPTGAERKSFSVDGEFGAAAMARDGKLHIATRKGVSIYSPEGTLETEPRSPHDGLPNRMLIERNGDIFLAGTTGSLNLGYVSRWEGAKPGWSSPRGKTASDTWKPASMAIFQTGNVLVAGDARREDGTSAVRIVKLTPDGKELFAVDLPGEGSTVAIGIDSDSNIAVLTKPSEGGAVIWSLEGARGLVRWKDDRLAVPEITPVSLKVDPRKFILVMLDDKKEGKSHGYMVRYSLGGEALNNFRPTDEVTTSADFCQDEFGEIYLAMTASRGAMVFRSASHLLHRYGIRYHFQTPYQARHIAVRDADGAGVVLGLSGDPAGPRAPVILGFRQAPIAKHEQFKVPANAPFTSPYSVLANDQHIEGAQMQLTAQPKNGSLEFRKDGTFTYTPRSGFSGKDTFRYQLNRGPLFWYAAIVTLEVGSSNID